MPRYKPDTHNPPLDSEHVFYAPIYQIGIRRCVDVPRPVSAEWKGQQHLAVRGWIEGMPMRGSLVPRGRGAFRLHIHSKICRKLGRDAGAAVEVGLQFDPESREPVVPEDLAPALADAPPALGVFRNLTTNLSAAIVRVEAAKRESTREKRISLCVRRMPERADRAKKHPAIIPDEAANLS